MTLFEALIRKEQPNLHVENSKIVLNPIMTHNNFYIVPDILNPIKNFLRDVTTYHDGAVSFAKRLN